MRILSTIWSLVALPGAIFHWMHANIIAPENDGKPLPPIRYDGDPSDIYLA